MIRAILNVLRMIVGLLLDIITLPVRALVALLRGAKFEFRHFGRRRRGRRR